MTTPSTLKPVTIAGIGSQPVQIAPSNSGMVNIYNGDISNVLLVAPNWNPNPSNSYPIQPLTNGTVDGSSALYAVAQTGTVATATIGGASQLSPSPAQIAQQINALGLATATNQGTQIGAANGTNQFLAGSATGVLTTALGRTLAQEIAGRIAGGSPAATNGGAPLLNMHQLINQALGVNVPAGTRTTLFTTGFNQPSWEIAVNLQWLVNALTQPNVQLLFEWIDSASGIVLWTDAWFLPAAAAGGGQNVFLGKGEALGNELQLSLANNDSTETVIVSATVWQTSQPDTRQDIRLSWLSTFSAPLFTAPDYWNPSANLLSQRQNAALAPAPASDVRLVPTFAGKVQLFGNTTSGTTDLSLTINDVGEGSMTNKAVFLINSDSSGHINASLTLPRSPCTVTMTNHNAAAQSVDWALVIQDY